jgi:hypothetical protein
MFEIKTDEFIEKTKESLIKSMYEECEKLGVSPLDFKWKLELKNGQLSYVTVGLNENEYEYMDFEL